MKRKCPHDGFDEEVYQPPKKQQKIICSLSEYHNAVQKALYEIKPKECADVLNIIIEYAKLRETNVVLEIQKQLSLFDIIMVSFKSNEVKLFIDNHKCKNRSFDTIRMYLWINVNEYLQLQENLFYEYLQLQEQ